MVFSKPYFPKTDDEKKAAIQDAILSSLFVGNPGVGKSTLANACAGDLFFKAGKSFGSGLTDSLDVVVKDGKVYIDIPGLADSQKKKVAAKAISQALQAGGNFQVVFVIKDDSGRVRDQDAATLEAVLKACDQITDNKFGIIVNQCEEEVIAALRSSRENFEQWNVCLQERFRCQTEFVTFVPQMKELRAKDDVLLHLSKIGTVEDFLKRLPELKISPGRAKDVTADEVEALEEEMKKKDQAIQKLLNEIKEDDANAKADMQRMQEDFDRRMGETNVRFDTFKGFCEMCKRCVRLDENNNVVIGQELVKRAKDVVVDAEAKEMVIGGRTVVNKETVNTVKDWFDESVVPSDIVLNQQTVDVVKDKAQDAFNTGEENVQNVVDRVQGDFRAFVQDPSSRDDIMDKAQTAVGEVTEALKDPDLCQGFKRLLDGGGGLGALFKKRK